MIEWIIRRSVGEPFSGADGRVVSEYLGAPGPSLTRQWMHCRISLMYR
ncbi:Uncharacterised protein [Escherichia coli]|uniref:Uncharacterized protein n=1 Tax=Escherichia coli TaxID=562 RepID=A0A376LJL4_ECOLX|nr:Uncharacterised protein [Escherichia coli]